MIRVSSRATHSKAIPLEVDNLCFSNKEVVVVDSDSTLRCPMAVAFQVAAVSKASLEDFLSRQSYLRDDYRRCAMFWFAILFLMSENNMLSSQAIYT